MSVFKGLRETVKDTEYQKVYLVKIKDEHTTCCSDSDQLLTIITARIVSVKDTSTE